MPVGHWSWDDVRDLVQTARTNAKATERLWLDQLKDCMGEGHLKTILGGTSRATLLITDRRPYRRRERFGLWDARKKPRTVRTSR